MPDDVVFAKMKIVRRKLTDAETSVAEREQVLKLADADCFPPPGSIATYVQPKEIISVVYQANLQAEEASRLFALCV